ncbi:uncharacterized protein TRUGW13939_01111 [Talaromyces rugulosus]|uniref:Yeast cell wall synthesis Kre9/Knh1-like N-terminal domain-containing protein n=1 Tax=Talaromyces rugulosus TaxID=121627 RepID=A0A7H8QJA0_TALRU|nr:uncharacterized protein TRUGW13939_01111 [Talaromyces rugulosus]QKX54029.1 hypothetical protein TRUGW13939_01111 [Talaromyces rugulosus]
MRFFALATGLFAALAAAASTPNAFIQPISGASFTAGKTSTLQWSPSTSGTVSLRLQWGALTTATEGIAIASSIDNSGTFSWSVPADIPEEADYFIRIASDADTSEVNYSARFTISGVTGVASTTDASSVIASATTSFSSAASTTTTLVTSTSPSTTFTSTTKTSTTSSSPTSTPASTSPTSLKTTATPSPTAASTTPASSSPAVSTTATTTSPSAAATTSVPNLNGGESVKVPGLLLGVVGLGAFVML